MLCHNTWSLAKLNVDRFDFVETTKLLLLNKINNDDDDDDDDDGDEFEISVSSGTRYYAAHVISNM